MTTRTTESNTQKPATDVKRKDIHQQVTDTIIKQLEQGTVPWYRPWIPGTQDASYQLPKNYTTGNKYRGINIVLLWAASQDQQFNSNEWASFKQWKEIDESVRENEKGTMIVYYDTVEREEEGEIKHIPFLKHSYVFNRNQLASYNPDAKVIEVPRKPLVDRIGTIEDFVANTNAKVEHDKPMACYSIKEDKISMPELSSFIDTKTCTATEGYYATLMHELTHWTGHTSRLDRKLSNKFGDKHYAVEELVAEMGAAFVCTEFDISKPTKEHHASYIAAWLDVLKQNKHAVFTAASEASKASEFLHRLQPTV
jgi:antirestriction protein ArdC